MARYIDADIAHEMLLRGYIINDVPIVDVQEVRHGKWLPIKAWFDDDYSIESENERYQTSWKCSLCGRIELIKEPYCHCGAKMDLEE